MSGIKAAGKQSAHIRLGRSIAATEAAETLLCALMQNMSRPLDVQKQIDERVYGDLDAETMRCWVEKGIALVLLGSAQTGSQCQSSK